MGKAIGQAGPVFLSPGEQRDVVLRAEVLPRSYLGQVVDPSGRPVEGAEVFLVRPDYSGWVEQTDAQGRFEFPGLTKGPLHLQFSKPGFIDLVLKQAPMPLEGQTALHRMEEARQVTLRFADDLGQRHRLDWMMFEGQLLERDDELGKGLLIGKVPRAGFPFEWRIGGAGGVVTVPAEVESFDVVVPRMTSCRLLLWLAATDRDRGIRCTFEPVESGTESSRPTSSEVPFHQVRSHLPAGGTSLEIPVESILPGRYRVIVHRSDWVEDDYQYTLLHQTQPFELVLGEHRELVLDL